MDAEQETELLALVEAHRRFANWERIRHRALTYANIEFPDGHPFKRSVENVCDNLEELRLRASLSLLRFSKK